MAIKHLKLLGGLAAAAVAAGVNLATELKYNVLAWVAVLALVALAVWLESLDVKAEQGVQRQRETNARDQQILLVTNYEEHSGDVHRMMSTTSEKVATEFFKRIPPLPDVSPKPPRSQLPPTTDTEVSPNG